MDYRGHCAAAQFDYNAGVFHGKVVDTGNAVIFEGTSIDQLRNEFHFSTDDYLAVCAERGREPYKPFPGRISPR